MPVTEFRLDTLVADVRAFMDEALNPAGDKDRASPFHLSACGGCGSPSWQQPCPSCGHYPNMSVDARKSELELSGEQARNGFDRSRWCKQVRFHGNIAAFHVHSFTQTVAYRTPSFKDKIDGLYARAKAMPAPEPEKIWDAVIRQHRALDGRPEAVPAARRGEDDAWRLEATEQGFDRHRASTGGRTADGREYYEERRLCRTAEGYGIFQSLSSWTPEFHRQTLVRHSDVVKTSANRAALIDEIHDWQATAKVKDQADAMTARGLKGEDDKALIGAGAVLMRYAAKIIENEESTAAMELRKAADENALKLSSESLTDAKRIRRLRATGVGLRKAADALERRAPERTAIRSLARQVAGLAEACRDLEPARREKDPAVR